jgi:nucleoid-associated protein YgaU
MPMLTRLSLIALSLLIFSGCAKLPAEKLETARSVVARAYAEGATDYAPGEYQLARSALAAAEKQIELGAYGQAEKTLDLSSRYAEEALKLSAAELERAAEERARREEQLRQAELEKQLEQKARYQAELQKQREEQKRLLAEAKHTAAKQAAAIETVAQKAETVQEPQLVERVEVAAGETLAMLAARSEVYDEADLWPLIYKANRDQIKDPREIFTGQVLVVPRDKSREELAAARKEAAEFGEF